MRVLREAYTEEDIRQRVTDTRNIFEALIDSCYILASCFEDTEGDKETNDKLSRYASGYARDVKDLAADFEDDYEDFIGEKQEEEEIEEESAEEETTEEEEVVEESLKEAFIQESRTAYEMQDDIDDLTDELDAVEGDRDECYITWNFGEDNEGNLTGGVDIHPHPRYEDDPEKIEELKAKVETIFRNHGFELDSAFKVNPGKTLFGAIHYQIKKNKDDFDGFFSNSDVTEGLEDTLRTVDFGEIKIVPNDKITKFDKFIKNDSVDEWSYYQTANGDVVATKNESLNKNLKEATMGSVEDFFKKMEGKSKAEAEKIVRQAKGNPNADKAYQKYLKSSKEVTEDLVDYDSFWDIAKADHKEAYSLYEDYINFLKRFDPFYIGFESTEEQEESWNTFLNDFEEGYVESYIEPLNWLEQHLTNESTRRRASELKKRFEKVYRTNFVGEGTEITEDNDKTNFNIGEKVKYHEMGFSGWVFATIKSIKGNKVDLRTQYGFEETGVPMQYLEKIELTEDTEKVKTGKWVNKGKEGTHGTFKTKKAADAQRKAMFANGYKEGLSESFEKGSFVVVDNHYPDCEYQRSSAGGMIVCCTYKVIDDLGDKLLCRDPHRRYRKDTTLGELIDKEDVLFSSDSLSEAQRFHSNFVVNFDYNKVKSEESLSESWMDNLDSDVYRRLYACKSRKSDIEPLVNAKWAAMREAGKDKKGFTREDALVSVLELLDENGCDIDLTQDEYNEILA